MTKVLILITKSNWGGAQRYVYDVATHLPKDAYTVEVMAGGNGPLITRLKEAGITADGTLPVGRNVSILKDIAAFFTLWNILRKKKPDVLHVNSSKIGGLGALAGRLARVPHIVFTAHGFAFNEERSLSSKLLIRLSYWVIFMLNHEIMAVSEAAARQVRDWPFIKNKITVVHNGIARSALFSESNARHALYTHYPVLKKAVEGLADRDIFWVGSIAELHHIKGYEYSIRAIRQMITSAKTTYPEKKIIYTICGDGEERPHLEKLIKEFGLEDHVFLLGHVADAAQYIPAFNVFLLSSLSEGLAYVILEAGLAHAPVVSTAVGGLPEVIKDMHSGILVQSKNSDELAHALSFMIEHPEDRKAYGAHLKATVLSEFSIEKMLREIQNVYKK